MHNWAFQIGDCGLKIGDWGLEIGDWGIGWNWFEYIAMDWKGWNILE